MLRAFGGVLLMAGLVLVLGRCDLAEPTEPRSLVVEAFLTTDRALPPITLRRTRPLDAPGSRAENAAQGAAVELDLDGQTVVYDERDSRPGRYVPRGASETARAGVPWALTVRWRGEVARAEGRVPPSIDLGEVCVDVPDSPVQAVRVDSLRRDSLDIPAERGYLYPVDVSLEWPAGSIPAGADTTHGCGRSSVPTPPSPRPASSISSWNRWMCGAKISFGPNTDSERGGASTRCPSRTVPRRSPNTILA